MKYCSYGLETRRDAHTQGTGEITLQTQHSVQCVLSIRKMPVNRREFRNYRETIAELAEQAREEKYVNRFRQLGIQCGEPMSKHGRISDSRCSMISRGYI